MRRPSSVLIDLDALGAPFNHSGRSEKSPTPAVNLAVPQRSA